MGGFKLTTEEIENIIKQKDGYYIEEKTENNHRYVKIRCHANHEWWVLLSNLKSGDWCNVCRKDIEKIDNEKIKNVLFEKGYILITKGKLTRTSRFKAKCIKHDYIWSTCYGNIKYSKQKNNCPLCAHNYPNIDVMREFLYKKDGQLLRIIKTSDSSERNLIVKCNKHNHIFRTRWNTLQKGHWCIKCGNEKRKITHEQIKCLVESKNGTLLDDYCFTATKLFKVRCNIVECKKEWKTSYSRICQGCWCPGCQYEKTQRILEDILKRILRTEIISNYRGFSWLKNKLPLEIDIWVPFLKLAIEYDGQQHFGPVKFAISMTDEQANTAYENVKFRDLQKTALIANHPEDIKYFIRFSYSEDITEESVIKKLKDCGVLNDICNNRGNIL